MSMEPKYFTKENAEISDHFIVTSKVQCNFPNLFVPSKYEEKETYNSMLLLDKETDKECLEKIKEAMEAASKDRWGKKIPKIKEGHVGLRDGDEYDNDAYAGKMFIRASNTKAPAVVDGGMNIISNPDHIKSGDYLRFLLKVFAYDTNGHKGIKFYLINAQFIETGPFLGGSSFTPDVADVFSKVEGFEELFASDEDKKEDDLWL